MPHKDDPDGEGLSGISFTEPSEGYEEEGGDTLFGLSNGLRSLDIKEPAVQHRIGIKVSSTSVRRFNREPGPCNFQMRFVPEREDEPTHMIYNPSECAPAPRGWSRAFPSRT